MRQQPSELGARHDSVADNAPRDSSASPAVGPPSGLVSQHGVDRSDCPPEPLAPTHSRAGHELKDVDERRARLKQEVERTVECFPALSDEQRSRLASSAAMKDRFQPAPPEGWQEVARSRIVRPSSIEARPDWVRQVRGLALVTN